jgi:hypothetical protein
LVTVPHQKVARSHSQMQRRKLDLKAEVESRASHFGIKRLVQAVSTWV